MQLGFSPQRRKERKDYLFSVFQCEAGKLKESALEKNLTSR